MPQFESGARAMLRRITEYKCRCEMWDGISELLFFQ